MRILIELAAQAIEMFAVAIIVIAIVHGTIRYRRVTHTSGLRPSLARRYCWDSNFLWRRTS